MKQVIPSKAGQIVKILNVLPGEDPDADYLLGEDPEPLENGKMLTVYSITELQRATAMGRKPFGDQIRKSDLTVIADSLEEWVKSWNALYKDDTPNNSGRKNYPSPS